MARVGLTSKLRQAFDGRSVFVAGHTGFKGSWLGIWLSEIGAKVTGYALPPPTAPSNFELSRVHGLLSAHHEADLRDRAALLRALDAAKPEVVFHLAAQSLVLDGYENPHETFDVNVIGTSCLLDCIRVLARPCVVIVVTSDKCYANTGQLWGYRECDPVGGSDPYSASKGAAEIVTAAYRESYFRPARTDGRATKVATVRAGNCIGGGDWAQSRVVPDIVRSLAEGKPVQLRNPGAVRPWQHVLDPLSGYLLLAAEMLASDDPSLESCWNFGPLPGVDLTVSGLTEEFFRAWGEGTWNDAPPPPQRSETGVLRLSVEKAIIRLGWHPTWDARQSVRKAAAWYAKHAGDPSANMRAACLEDIEAYANEAAEGTALDNRVSP